MAHKVISRTTTSLAVQRIASNASTEIQITVKITRSFAEMNNTYTRSDSRTYVQKIVSQNVPEGVLNYDVA